MDDIDPREAKLLADMLALVLADSDGQAEAALLALRRRAAAESISGGAIKHALERALAGLHQADSRGQDEAHQLRWMIDDLRRELAETRIARQRAHAALLHAQGQALTVEPAPGRGALLAAFLAGLALAGLAAIGAQALRRPADAGLDRAAQARLADDLHDCFLASSNSLVGSPIPLHVRVQLDADGRITGAQWAPDQAARVVDLSQRIYGEMVVRTFTGGSCGALALPASLRGRPARLDLILPR